VAIANALMIHGTLDAAMIDIIIAAAPERARRADWAKVMESAADMPFEEGPSQFRLNRIWAGSCKTLLPALSKRPLKGLR
jgi:hypothetical protein